MRTSFLLASLGALITVLIMFLVGVPAVSKMLDPARPVNMKALHWWAAFAGVFYTILTLVSWWRMS